MSAALARARDAWIFDAYRTPAQSLGVYRILYALYLLLFIFPDFTWVADFPSSFFAAPPGPMRLFTSFPPEEALAALEALLAVAAVFLLFGLGTRTASLAVGVLLFVGMGFEYSMGKINHGWLLFRVVPLCLAFSGWGERWSLDALRGRRARRGDDGWPVSLLALLVALALLTAVVPKVQAGWLSPETRAVRGYVVRNMSVHDRDPLLAELVLRIDSELFWAALDYATVAVEAGLLLALVSPLAFRVALALLVLFHAGVYLTMGITFSIAVVAYGAFVRWDRLLPARARLPGSGTPDRLRALATRPWLGPAALVLVGLAYHAVQASWGPPVAVLWARALDVGPKAADQLSLVVGTALSLGFLAAVVRVWLLRWRRPARSAR